MCDLRGTFWCFKPRMPAVMPGPARYAVPMLTEAYIEALLVDPDPADQDWQLWNDLNVRFRSKAVVQSVEIESKRTAANGRVCVKTPQQSDPRSRLQTQRETLLTGLRADNVLLVSN